jgi:hypothetical protein
LPVGALEQEELRAAARTLGLDAAYFEIRRRKISRRPFAEERSAEVLISSHRKLLLSNAMVVSVAETPGQDSGRQG